MASKACRCLTSDSDNPRLFTTREAADTLKMSYDWLKKRAAADEVPHTRIGRSVRFTREHIEEIVRGGERASKRRGEDAPPRAASR